MTMPYRQSPPDAPQSTGPAKGRWPIRWACAVLGHRWMVLRVNYYKAMIVPSVFLCGRDLDCLRCGERWRDGGPWPCRVPQPMPSEIKKKLYTYTCPKRA